MRTSSFESLFCSPPRNGVYKAKKYLGTGVPFIRMKELFSRERIAEPPDDCERIQLSEAELDKSRLQPGDLLFSRTSVVASGVGKCALITKMTSETSFDSNIIRIRLDRTSCDPSYYFYYFSSSAGRESVLSLSSGTSVTTITGSGLRKLQVPTPSLPTQRRIASILSAYDDLIENNTKRIEILEEMARSLYREWFVHFRFPGHEKVKLVDSELGKIPEGWEVVPLGSVATVNKASIKKGKAPKEIHYVDIKSVSTDSIDEYRRLNFDDAPGRARRLITEGDVLWSTVRPNRRSYARVHSPPSNPVASTGFAVLSPGRLPTSYIYCTTTTDAFVNHLVNHARGAAYPAVTGTDFEVAEVVVPTDDVLSAFDSAIRPMFSLVGSLHAKNNVLGQTRDLLLPKLISGEIDVDALDLAEAS